MAARQRVWWQRRHVAVALIVAGFVVGVGVLVTTALWTVRSQPQSSALVVLGWMGGGVLALGSVAAAVLAVAISRAPRRGSTASAAVRSVLEVWFPRLLRDPLETRLIDSLRPSGRETLRTTTMPPPKVVRSSDEPGG